MPLPARFGYSPHRIATLIYWQAVKLLWKGARFYSPPKKALRKDLSRWNNAKDHSSSVAREGEISACPFQWVDVTEHPWRTD